MEQLLLVRVSGSSKSKLSIGYNDIYTCIMFYRQIYIIARWFNSAVKLHTRNIIKTF